MNHREAACTRGRSCVRLRGALREDPDIILVGEMRDLRRLSSRSPPRPRATLFSARCTPSISAKTVDRVIDVFPTNQQNQIRATLAESLKGVISQNLFRRVDRPGRVAALEILAR